MNPEIKTSKFYDECCDFFGNLGWAASCYIDENSQTTAYKSIIKYLPLNNSSVLDVGCGQGDFLKFIYDNNLNNKISKYKGIDVSQKMIDFASSNFSKDFFSKQYFLSEQNYDFDLSVAAGTFNTRVFDNDIDQIDYLKNNINKMFNVSKKACALTLLSYHGYEEIKKENRLFCYEPWEIIQYCFSLTNSVIIDHASMQAEFVLILYH
jgi:ubiquinone/menaquinone biosynthesis C-methylase UbiE